MVNKPRHLGSSETKTYLIIVPIKYNEGTNYFQSIGSVLDPANASVVAALHLPILDVGTLRLLS